MRKIAFLTGLIAGALPAAGPARADTVVVTRQTCDQLVQHVPDADVPYQPGVDVNGRPVAPADLPGNAQIKIPETFEIPITVDLGQRLGIPSDPKRFRAKAQIGTVTYRDGQAYLNGQPLHDPDAAALSRACQKIMQGN